MINCLALSYFFCTFILLVRLYSKRAEISQVSGRLDSDLSYIFIYKSFFKISPLKLGIVIYYPYLYIVDEVEDLKGTPWTNV